MRVPISKRGFPRSLCNRMKKELEDIQFCLSIGLGIETTRECTRYILETPQFNNTRVQSMLIAIALIQ